MYRSGTIDVEFFSLAMERYSVDELKDLRDVIQRELRRKHRVIRTVRRKMRG